ncbi:MAG: alkaline phosphatase family protein [Myxococcales bacterium]|nr:alkaline phosphatase family protein [Myxococcales bacterium]
MRRLRLLILLAVVAIGVGAYLQTRDIADQDRVGAPAEPPYLTLFLVDGFAPEVFQKALAAGRMPNLAKLIDGGVYVPQGVCAFPSMTAFGFYGFLTGRDAPTGGPLGLRWFDRTKHRGPFRRYVGRTNGLLNEDMITTERTLFEKFAPEHSFSLNSYANRGVWTSKKTGGLFTMTKYKDHWWVAKLVNAIGPLRERFGPGWVEVERRVIQMAIDDLPHRPKIQWVTLVSPDTYGHVYGLTDEYEELLVSIDGLIGDYVAAAAAADGGAPRYYAVVGDHGVESVRRHFDPGEIFRRVGLDAFRGPATHLFEDELEDERASYDEHDAVVAINGNLMAYVYVKAPDAPAPWSRPPTYEELTHYATPQGEIDLVARYLAEEAIEHVITRRSDEVFEVASRRGVGLVTTSSAGFAYHVVSGEDPLGYVGDPVAGPLVESGPHSARAWLEATQGTVYPHGVVRVARLMLHPGAGDLVLTSAPDFDLAPDFELFVGEYNGGHGGLRRSQILAPYIVSGPGIPKAQVDIATAEDIGATLHVLLKAPLHEDAEGRSLLPETAP